MKKLVKVVVMKSPHEPKSGDILRRKAFEEITFWRFKEKVKGHNTEDYYTHTLDGSFYDATQFMKPVHLYFVLNEQSQKGRNNVYYYDENKNIITQWHQESETYCKAHFKEVIATTNPDLKYHIKSEIMDMQRLSTIEKLLPRPSTEFLIKFCKAEGIFNVEVEFEEIRIDEGFPKYLFVPKVAKDNTITIYPVEPKIYSSTEVKKLFKKFADDLTNHTHIPMMDKVTEAWINKHIK